MADLTYNDFKSRIDIQDVLADAGYTLNRRDGMRYPSYVRVGSDGKRVRGDKFIVTANGLCCFQPPERKNYNVISFIKEHPEMFAEYRIGMSKDRLVNLVCNRLLNNPIESRPSQAFKREQSRQEPFDIGKYDVKRFDAADFESQKPFYPYFKNRGISLDTQRAFSEHFFLAAKQRTDGKSYTNLSFPLSLPAAPGGMVGLEERSRPNAEGKTAYKGMAAGSNASEGLWIARLDSQGARRGCAKPMGEAKDVYWFESAFDAMAYFQLQKEKLKGELDFYKSLVGEANPDASLMIRAKEKSLEDLANAVFVSTGGSPTDGQIDGMAKATSSARHVLCFDADKAGEEFARIFGERHPELTSSREYPKAGYKDWNDQLLNKPMTQQEGQSMGGMRR